MAFGSNCFFVLKWEKQGVKYEKNKNYFHDYSYFIFLCWMFKYFKK